MESKPSKWILRTWSVDGKYCHVNQCESEHYLNLVIQDLIAHGRKFQVEGLRR